MSRLRGLRLARMQARMTSPHSRDRSGGRSRDAASRDTVLVLAPLDEDRAIGDALRFSPFAGMIPGTPGVGLPEAAVAVLVSDRLDNHDELCRDWAGRRPVLLVSDRRDFSFRIAAVRAGVSAIVDRPVDPVSVAASLKAAIGGEVERLSVVLVEDDILSGELSAAILRASGMDVVVVNDPARLLETVQRLLPDLILMDLNMPGASGIELAQVIRLNRHLVAIPILFLSGERNLELQRLARRFGGDDFLSKPIDPRVLVATVRLRGERARALRAVIERDALTGLLDRGAFHDHLTTLAGQGERFSLALLDIDLFKDINDTHGHAVGDQVIQTLAQLLVSDFEQKVIVGRCGGEEFGVILLDTDKATACRVIDRVRRRFAATAFEAGPTRFTASFSAGVAGSFGTPSPLDLFRAADEALYAAKRGGRNRLSAAA